MTAPCTSTGRICGPRFLRGQTVEEAMTFAGARSPTRAQGIVTRPDFPFLMLEVSFRADAFIRGARLWHYYATSLFPSLLFLHTNHFRKTKASAAVYILSGRESPMLPAYTVEHRKLIFCSMLSAPFIFCLTFLVFCLSALTCRFIQVSTSQAIKCMLAGLRPIHMTYSMVHI